jgi:hypothetical protein
MNIAPPSRLSVQVEILKSEQQRLEREITVRRQRRGVDEETPIE